MRPESLQAESGASAVIVAVVVVLLFGMTALAVDVANMYEERRQLQRTADLAVTAGARDLLSGNEATAEATGQQYVGENPTRYHPGGYNAAGIANGDLVDAILAPHTDAECSVNGVYYDCVKGRVEAPARSGDYPKGFDFFFADVLHGIFGSGGDAKRPVAAKAVAVLGAGAPGGDRLVPWMVLDCPNPALYSDEAAVDPAQVNENCDVDGGYKTSVSFNQYPVDLFLGQGGGSKGNFQGADLSAEPDECPDYADQIFGKSGGHGIDAYRSWLAGKAEPGEACTIDLGARLFPEPGSAPQPTNQGLTGTGPVNPPGRGATQEFCSDPANFDAATDPDPSVPGGVIIRDLNNPCLVAIIFAVHPDPAQSGEWGATNPMLRGAARIAEWQHPEPLNFVDGRFSGLGGPANPGASEMLLVRRFGLFYITGLGGPGGGGGGGGPCESNCGKPWTGVFLKALNSVEFELGSSPCAGQDVCVVKLIN
jgi:hypothetical protein